MSTSVLSRMLSASSMQAVGAALGAWLASMPACQAQSLPFPAKLQSVIERGEIEGRPVQVTRFESELAVHDVIVRLLRAWSDHGRVPVIQSTSGTWRIVSSFDAGHYRTAQVRAQPGGASEGLLTVWADAPRTAPRGLDLADVLPADATVLRRFAATDAGRRSETLVATAPSSVGWLLPMLDRRFASMGLLPDPVVRSPAGSGARLYRGRGAEVAVTAVPHEGRSGLVFHLTEDSR